MVGFLGLSHAAYGCIRAGGCVLVLMGLSVYVKNGFWVSWQQRWLVRNGCSLLAACQERLRFVSAGVAFRGDLSAPPRPARLHYTRFVCTTSGLLAP